MCEILLMGTVTGVIVLLGTKFPRLITGTIPIDPPEKLFSKRCCMSIFPFQPFTGLMTLLLVMFTSLVVVVIVINVRNHHRCDIYWHITRGVDKLYASTFIEHPLLTVLTSSV